MILEAQQNNADPRLARADRRRDSANPELWRLLDSVRDPEIPVISIWDLGVLQDLHMDGGTVEVVITPTYSGCPAMREIEADIRACLAEAGYKEVRVEHRLAPAWTSEWLSEKGRDALLDYGIAPPCRACGGTQQITDNPACPQCGAEQTECVSEFGSTACKALYRCKVCLEPFDYFKRI